MDPYLYITDWLSKQSHTENKEKEIDGMRLNIDAISKLTYIQDATKMTCT